MSTSDETKRQQELERRRQERERQIRRDEELRRIREIQIHEKQKNDIINKGKPTGERPRGDD